MTIKKVFITGGTGFIGSALIRELISNSDYELSALVRQSTLSPFISDSQIKKVVGDLNDIDKWSKHLEGVDVIIHAAAQTQLISKQNNLLEKYREINVEPVKKMAKVASISGVKRFIFLSSIKVNGEQNTLDKPFSVQDTPNPTDAYGITKLEAEQALFNIAGSSSMEVVVLRPPLVYGPGVKGNFLTMLKWVDKGLPLPLGGIKGKRSFVGIQNLVDLVCLCVKHPDAANRVFMVSDDDDISLPELLVKIGRRLGKKTRLLPIPAGLILMLTSIAEKKAAGHRLVGNLRVEVKETQKILNWTPMITLEEGLDDVISWYQGK